MATKKKVDDADDAQEEAPAKDAQQGVTKEEGAIDETVPGGRYKVGDKLVNSEGEEVK